MERLTAGDGSAEAMGRGGGRLRLYIGLGVVVALLVLVGFPVGLAAITGRETARDIIIITWGVLSIVAFVLLIWLLLVLGLGVMRVVRIVNVTVAEDVRPILATTRESVNNVTGTSRFLADSVAIPVIRLYSIIAGIRRWLGIITGLARRGRTRA
ncbi:MAG: hypothetical protein U0531_13730 [Dehalococcoidia bacterium]